MAHDEYEHQRRQTAPIKVTIDPALLVAMQDSVNRTFERIEMARQTGTVPPRPCCHATGPNHHPACTTNRTEQQ